MKEKVLILEDSQERLDWFFDKFKDKYIVHNTDKPQEAINLLDKIEFNYVLLDHDLLPEHYNEDTNCNKTTGLCVAEWLGNNLDRSKDAMVIIHSLNWNGSARMQNAMKLRENIQCVPYHKLQELININE